VVEESDESVFWMDVLIEAEVVKPHEINYLLKEGTKSLK